MGQGRASGGMGLPMLQFATAYTYFIQSDLRESLRAQPYSLHAIYSHGHDDLRKRALLREAMGWHDPPGYYGGNDDEAKQSDGGPARQNDGRRWRYLTYEMAPPERASRHGGFELILSQLRRFELAMRLAALSNRTLIMSAALRQPAMVYPCYAWNTEPPLGGMRHDRVPMPRHCPTYYWLNHQIAEAYDLREPSLQNPRTPAPSAPPHLAGTPGDQRHFDLQPFLLLLVVIGAHHKGSRIARSVHR